MHSAVGWNVRGKGLDALVATWDVLDLEAVDFLFLQEVGGLQEAAQPHDRIPVKLGTRKYTAVVASLEGGFRGLAVCIPEALAMHIETAHVLTASLLVVIKQFGIRTYLLCAHLPYAQRRDCLPVWQEFTQQLDARISCMRYHDVLLGGADLNFDVHAHDQGGGEERLSLLGDLALSHAISVTRPGQATWQNSQGSQSRIDYLLYRAPQAEVVEDEVVVGPEELLDMDHRPVLLSVASLWGRCPRHTARRNGSWTRAGLCMHVILWLLIWNPCSKSLL